jgi:glycosyltransferase involved in cell wall biosynthesis
VVVNSKAIERHLIEDLRIPARRAYLSYNGVETEVFHPRPGGRLPGAPLVIGSLCALREEKRMDLLLDAFAHAALEGVQLLIVGSGERLPALESQRHRLGLEKVCRFEPAQTEVADWFRSMDIFVLPSRSESFPNALLEAMACGCCAIGSRVGGIPELIEHGENGLLFDSGDAAQLADALTLVVRDEALRQRLSAEAARTARERFSMAIATRRMQSLYESLLERARRGDPL